ncbi:LSM domain-containing 1 [Micractinium conductrix]|uniref:LSM domain-containing 1 n=1 Tax=Micractinium conductrix TaxID=554055 RepID=A0A2P6V2F1_9CHLO|nr:LSM domain-containing 1 [Micractinium conductrix]|eukprot:PSC68263.1 LSM domain-containing 1 [Micractinium conductrix]
MQAAGQRAAQPPSLQTQERSPVAERAAALLHKRCRIHVRDGRVLVGDFNCLDRQGNIILANTHEVLTVAGRPHEKLMGQVLVPAAHRVSIEFQAVNPSEHAALQQLLSWRPEGS